MGNFIIKKGYDIDLPGRPANEVKACEVPKYISLYPVEFKGIKQRLKAKEGDVVKRGSELIEDKRNPDFKLRSPAGGRIKSITRGARRVIAQILIEVDENEKVEKFDRFSIEEIQTLTKERALGHLANTGYLAFIKQRPFSGIADINSEPKSIFINAMNTGPFQVDNGILVEDDPEGFKAGIALLTTLTDGDIHLCTSPDAPSSMQNVESVKNHTFVGPHPAGNTSIHIDRIDPMDPTDVVWTVKAADLVLIGRLLLDGELPENRIVCLGGSGVNDDARKHYKLRIGSDLSVLLNNNLTEGEQRIISGDVLSGKKIEKDGCLPFYNSSITVIPEGRDRHFLGWMMPGVTVYSVTNTFVSSFIAKFTGRRFWKPNTNRNGGHRAMVLTGLYDRVVPLDIMVDFLIRAVLAGDTDEAIQLGILETEPEDFALCDFICPSKTEVQEIIRQGLKDIEIEGI